MSLLDKLSDLKDSIVEHVNDALSFRSVWKSAAVFGSAALAAAGIYTVVRVATRTPAQAVFGGKMVLIVNSGLELAESLARQFLEAGATVCVCDPEFEVSDTVVRNFRDSFPPEQIFGYAFGVDDPRQIHEAKELLEERSGKTVDVLVLARKWTTRRNARFSPAIEKVFLPEMRERGKGHIARLHDGVVVDPAVLPDLVKSPRPEMKFYRGVSCVMSGDEMGSDETGVLRSDFGYFSGEKTERWICMETPDLIAMDVIEGLVRSERREVDEPQF